MIGHITLLTPRALVFLFRDGGGPGGEGGGGGGGGGSGDDNGSQGSQRSRSHHEPWNRPSKARSKFNEKITWNGSRITFHECRKATEEHLLQADAGCLIDPKFLLDCAFQKSRNAHMEHLKSDEFWTNCGTPFAQAKSDKQPLCGILVSSSGQTDNKVILMNKKDLDGITAWMQMTMIVVDPLTCELVPLMMTCANHVLPTFQEDSLDTLKNTKH
jgi:hypothetical protein